MRGIHNIPLRLVGLGLVAALVAACQTAPSPAPGTPAPAIAGAPATRDTLDKIKERGTLRVGTWLQYKPEMYKDPASGEAKGFWVEMARKMATDLGVKAEFIDSDFDGLIPGLQSDKWDIVLAQMAITAERAKAVDFAKPWEAVGMSLVVPADSSTATVDDLNKAGKKIVTITGGVSQQVYKARLASAEEVAIKAQNDGFLTVGTRRADAFLTDNVSAQVWEQEHKGSIKVLYSGVGQPFLVDFPTGPAVPKGTSDKLIRWTDIWLQDQLNNGTYARLYQQEVGWEAAIDQLQLKRGGY